jgi:hypothetical protein
LDVGRQIGDLGRELGNAIRFSKDDLKTDTVAKEAIPSHLNTQTSVASPCIPGKARVGAGPDAYKNFCDEELGKMMIKEAKTIRDLADHWLQEASLDDRMTGKSSGALAMFFRYYEKCCESDVNVLRAEALNRLGVLAKSPEEDDKWSQLQNALQSFPPTHPFATDRVKGYSPYLRSIGLELERKGEPRSPPKSLEFKEESILADPQWAARGFKVGTLISVPFKDSVASGYLAVEFNHIRNGNVSSDLTEDGAPPRNWLQDNLVDYDQLRTYQEMTFGKLEIYHFGEKAPISKGTIIHFVVSSSQEIHAVRVTLWPD